MLIYGHQIFNTSIHVNISQRPPNLQNKQSNGQNKPSRIIDRTNHADKEVNLQSTEANSDRLVLARMNRTPASWFRWERLRRSGFGENEAKSSELVSTRKRQTPAGWFRRERRELRRALISARTRRNLTRWRVRRMVRRDGVGDVFGEMVARWWRERERERETVREIRDGGETG